MPPPATIDLDDLAEDEADINLQTRSGGDVKAGTTGKVAGYLVKFDKVDRQQDVFKASTKFDLPSDGCASVPVYIRHGIDPSYGRRAIGRAWLSLRPDGVWCEATLDLTNPGGREMFDLATKGEAAWSSGSASRFVERKLDPTSGVAVITNWPIFEASIQRKDQAVEPTLLARAIKARPPVVSLSRSLPPARRDRLAAVRRITQENPPMSATIAPSVARSLTPRLDAILGEDTKAFEFGYSSFVDFLIRGTNPKYEAAIKATGLELAQDSNGGVLVPPAYSESIWRAAVSLPLTPLPYIRTATTNSNTYQTRTMPESSRADGSRKGGLRAVHVGEGALPTKSRPGFGTVEYHLNKLVVDISITEELFDDVNLQRELEEACIEELAWGLSDAIIRGTGVGMGTGLIRSTSRVTIAAEGGQTAATVVLQNLLKMWEAMHNDGKPRAVWMGGPGVETQLAQLALSGGAAARIVQYAPPGTPGGVYLTVFGRPFIPCEQCEAVGTEGDLILADLSAYQLITRSGNPKFRASMHVRFDTGEGTLRWVTRYDGRLLWHASRTPYRGSTAQSAVVTLAAR